MFLPGTSAASSAHKASLKDPNKRYDERSSAVDPRKQGHVNKDLRNHNVEQWHRRVKIFEGNSTKQKTSKTKKRLNFQKGVRAMKMMRLHRKMHQILCLEVSLEKETKKQKKGTKMEEMVRPALVHLKELNECVKVTNIVGFKADANFVF